MAATVDQKLLKATKFPPEFAQKVDIKKVNVEVMKKWIAGKISNILSNEDDVVIELCFGLLEGQRYPDIKSLQIQLTGFLDKDTPKFCKELWNLCLSAQSNPQGVPKELLEAKKLELIQEKIDAEKAAEEARKRHENERTREQDVNDVRQRERADRGRGRGSGRGGRGYDSRRPRSRSPPPYRRDSRSPPRRRRDSPPRGVSPHRDRDVYVPRGRGDRGGRPSNGRNRSISRSPPSRTDRGYGRGAGAGRGAPRRRRSLTRSLSRSRSVTRSRTRSVSRSRSRSRSPPPRQRRPTGRLSRSASLDNSRSPPPRRRKRRRTPSRTRSPSLASRSISRDRHRDRRRRGSVPRYQPATRRKNSSSEPSRSGSDVEK